MPETTATLPNYKENLSPEEKLDFLLKEDKYHFGKVLTYIERVATESLNNVIIEENLLTEVLRLLDNFLNEVNYLERTSTSVWSEVQDIFRNPYSDKGLLAHYSPPEIITSNLMEPLKEEVSYFRHELSELQDLLTNAFLDVVTVQRIEWNGKDAFRKVVCLFENVKYSIQLLEEISRVAEVHWSLLVKYDGKDNPKFQMELVINKISNKLEFVSLEQSTMLLSKANEVKDELVCSLLKRLKYHFRQLNETSFQEWDKIKELNEVFEEYSYNRKVVLQKRMFMIGV